MPQAIPILLAAAATWGPFGAAIGSFSLLSSFAIRAGLGLALNFLSKPKGPIDRGRNITDYGPAQEHQIIYGLERVAGARVADFTTGDSNTYLHRVVCFAGHEINSYEAFFLAGQKITDLELDSTDGDGIPKYNVKEVADLDENGDVVEDTRSNKWDGLISIYPHVGTSDQVADSTLVSDVTEWTSNHRLRGLAYCVIVYTYSTEGYPAGLPPLTAEIKGMKLYDPRTETTVWSDNAALCLRDYIVNDYGLGETTSRMDDTLSQAAANICDQTASDGSTRYTCNGSFRLDVQPGEVIKEMILGMAGFVWYAQGYWRIKAGSWTSAILDLDENDLRSAVSVKTRHSRRANYNVVRGLYHGPETNWQDTDYPEVRNHTVRSVANGYDLDYTTNITSLVAGNWYSIRTVSGSDFTAVGASSNEVGVLFQATGSGSGSGDAYDVEDVHLITDNNLELPADINMPFKNTSVESRRVARILLEGNRQQITLSGTWGLRAVEAQIGSTVRISHERFGWSLKEFVVVDWSLELVFSGDNATSYDIQVGMQLRETSSTVYDEVDDGIVYERDNTTLASPFTVPTPVLGDPSTQLIPYDSGVYFPSLFVDWTAGSSAEMFLIGWRESAMDYSANGGIVVYDDLSTEREYDVYDAYTELLFRAPDQDGFDYYVGGADTIADIRTEIGNSIEAGSQVDFNEVYRSSKQIQISPVKVGVAYDVTVRSQNALGKLSPKSVLTHIVTADTDAPPIPVWHADDTTSGSTITNTISGKVVNIRWENPPTDSGGTPVYDLKETEVWRTDNVTLIEDSEGEPTNAVYVGSAAKSGPISVFTDNSGALGTTYKYYLRAVDYAGNKSEFDDGRNVTTENAGADDLRLDLTTNFIGIPTDSDGSNPVYTDAEITATVINGATDDTSNWTITRTDSANITSTLSTDTVTITALSADTAYVDISAERSGYATITRRVSVAKIFGGEAAVSVVHLVAYKRDSSIPSPPTGGSYDFDTRTLTPPSGWSAAIPAGSDPVYTSTSVASVVGGTGEDLTLTWTSPILFAQDGERGPGRWYIPEDPLPTTSGEANTAFLGDSETPASAVAFDQAIFYLGTVDVQTEQSVWVYNGTSWTEQSKFLDGSFTLTGTLTAAAIVTDDITVRDKGDGTLQVADSGIDVITLSPGATEINSAISISTEHNSSSAVTSGSFVVGERYVIKSVGTTDFTLIGGKNNTVGTPFIATGVGAGDGTAVKGFLDNSTRVVLDGIFDTNVTVQWAFRQDYPSGLNSLWGYQLRQSSNYEAFVTVQDKVIDAGWSGGTSERVVFDAYWDILLRIPDQDGFDYYVDEIDTAAITEDQLRSLFMESSEYTNGLITNRSFMVSGNDAPSGFEVIPIYGGGHSMSDIEDGRDYIITSITSDSDDFTALGASRNDVGVTFTATDDGPFGASRVTPILDATDMAENEKYMIYDVGTTDFTSYGADFNYRGHIFRATDTGTGTGRVLRVAEQSIILEWMGETSGGSTVSATSSLAVRGSKRS